MAITTTIARHFAWRHWVMVTLCLVFGVWGAYDLWFKIPNNQKRYDRYQEVLKRSDEIKSISQSRPLTTAEADEAEKVKAEERELAPAGAIPKKPGEFDRATQWAFIICILFVPYFLFDLQRTARRVYTLDDDGTLHLPVQTLPSSTWRREEIADIDMDRWMAKSMAWVVHTDGTRVKLDDYKHRNLHLIIGAIAARLHPEKWTPEAKPVKPAAAESVAAEDEAEKDREGAGEAAVAAGGRGADEET